MGLILEMLIDAGVIMLLASVMKSVDIRSYGTAILVALVIGLLNATVGFLMRLPLNILTLGLLSFVVRLVVTAVVIRMADRLFKGFEVKTWSPAFIIAACLALAGTLFSSVYYGGDY